MKCQSSGSRFGQFELPFARPPAGGSRQRSAWPHPPDGRIRLGRLPLLTASSRRVRQCSGRALEALLEALTASTPNKVWSEQLAQRGRWALPIVRRPAQVLASAYVNGQSIKGILELGMRDLRVTRKTSSGRRGRTGHVPFGRGHR